MHLIVLFLLSGAVAVVLAIQIGMRAMARRAVGRRAPDCAQDGRSLYYFYAPHCGPCRAMAPLVERLQEDFPNLRKVDIAESPDLARQMGILATPSFAMVDGGVIRAIKLGAQSEATLRRLLEAR